MTDPHDFTDIHIHMANDRDDQVDVEGSLLFPGARSAVSSQSELLRELASLCRGKRRPDFMIDFHGVFFRVRRDEFAVDGLWFRLRRMEEKPPRLQDLPQAIAIPIQAQLLSAELVRGGLIMVVGSTGAGKTTTAAATVVSRLEVHGGVAYTVEEPVELPLNGRHGSGYCTQTEVAGGNESDWVESLRGVLRSQPVRTPVMLYVGEIRDVNAARMVLRAATNGFLVICTAFGSNVINSLSDFLSLIGRENADVLAQVLRLSIHQTLKPDRLIVESLWSDGPNSRVAAVIRNGSLNQLQDEIQLQRNAMVRQTQMKVGSGSIGAVTT